jgi:hypothetical protein
MVIVMVMVIKLGKTYLRRVPLVEQELLTVPWHPSSPTVFSGVRVTRSIVLCVCFVDRSHFVLFRLAKFIFVLIPVHVILASESKPLNLVVVGKCLICAFLICP